jgi:hypothetical protein
MQAQRKPKKIMKTTFEGRRSQGRPRNRWYSVRKDANQLLGIRNRTIMAKLKRGLEKART